MQVWGGGGLRKLGIKNCAGRMFCRANSSEPTKAKQGSGRTKVMSEFNGQATTVACVRQVLPVAMTTKNNLKCDGIKLL